MSILANNLQKLARVIVLRRTVEQGFGVALNGGQRRPQLVGNVGNEIATGFLHPLGLGQVTQNGNGAAPGHGSGGYIESTARNNGSRSCREHLSGFAGSAYSTQEIGVAHGFNDGSIQPGALRNQAIHTLVGPLHAVVGTDSDHGVLHAVQQGFELALAGSQSREVALYLTRGLVESGSDLTDFISRIFGDTRREFAAGDLVGKLDDPLQPPRRELGQCSGKNKCNPKSKRRTDQQRLSQLRCSGSEIG